MYGSINYDNKYELKVIETNCSSCGLSIELREGLPAYCPACFRIPNGIRSYSKINLLNSNVQLNDFYNGYFFR